jgi:hypothetical protein
MVAVFGIALIAIAVDLGLVQMPWRLGQVPAEYLTRWGAARAYFYFGVRFGLAFTTVVPYAVTLSLFAVLSLKGQATSALIGGALFGLGRTVLIGPGSRRATWLSWFLYRRPGVRRWWKALSVVATVLIVACECGVINS